MIIWWCKVRPVWMRHHCLSIMCDDLCDAHTCVQPTVVMEEEPFRIILWDVLEGKDSDFLRFEYSGWSSSLSSKARSSQKQHLYHPKTLLPWVFQLMVHSWISSSVGMSFGHSIDCCLDSGSKWWTLVSSHMTVCDRKPSPPASYWCKKKVAVAFIVCNCLVSFYAHVSMSDTEGVQTLE
jgi:hypothetical protein